VVSLQDALARAREVSELQRRADDARSEMIKHLQAAISSGERADTFRRQALLELEESVSAMSGPGHPGEVD
jgi:hypothetical protein